MMYCKNNVGDSNLSFSHPIFAQDRKPNTVILGFIFLSVYWGGKLI